VMTLAKDHDDARNDIAHQERNKPVGGLERPGQGCRFLLGSSVRRTDGDALKLWDQQRTRASQAFN
jgi:hypothetical protein